MLLKSSRFSGRTVHLGDLEFLYFGGTAYLGMPANKEFLAYLKEGMERYGTNYGSSRSSNLQLEVFDQAENKLAAASGAEAALSLSSGYLACQLVIRSLEGKGRFIYAPDCHPALWQSKKDLFYQDYNEWADALPEQVSRTREKNVVIISNAVDALHVRAIDLSWISRLPEDKNCTVVLDDSHGLGITGNNGGGIYGQVPANPGIHLIVVSSLGKAMGLPGGVVLSGARTIRALRSSPFFSASSPVVPAYLHAYLRSGELYRQAREKIRENIKKFNQATESLQLFDSLEDYPVFHTPHHQLYEYLKTKNILISSFPYPSSGDPPVTRVVLSSLHTEEDIERLAEALEKFQ